MRPGGSELKSRSTVQLRIPRIVRNVLARLRAGGFDGFPVGGCVRDLLLGRKVTDWDVTSNARPDQVVGLFERVIPTGIQHGTVTVLLGGSNVEVTTFRGEVGYQDGRHPDRVVFLDSLEDDLRRRDFTINAMAFDVRNSRIIDPFGGRRDLSRRRIRAVGDPAKRFAEDGLRPLRAIRFATVLDFVVDRLTFRAIEESIPIFRKVSAERVREELLKILSSRQARKGIELLQRSRLLAEIIPELLEGCGYSQNRFHRHDVYSHALGCLEHAHGDPIVKLAILLHDVGKPKVAAGPAGERTFFGHEKVSAEIAAQIMRRLRFSKEDLHKVNTLITNHMFHYQPGWSDGAVRRLVRRVGENLLQELWEVRRADAWGRGMGVRGALANLRSLKRRVKAVFSQDAALKVADLAIGGHEVMEELRLPPGPIVGKLLNVLLDRVIEDPSLNRKDRLVALLKVITLP